MTNLERHMFSVLIKKYVDGHITNGCSDIDVVKEFGLTLAECEDLHQRMAVWNKAPDEAMSGPIFQDWYLTLFLLSLFEAETALKETPL